MTAYKRPIFNTLKTCIIKKRKFIQILAGLRQTGKATLARQLMADIDIPGYYATADEPALKGSVWIEQQRETARINAGKNPGLLILDEIHKIGAWSETVKRLWDQDSADERDIRIVLLGSAPLLIWSDSFQIQNLL